MHKTVSFSERIKNSGIEIIAYSCNKLSPRIPPLPHKTQFIKLKFINQGLDLLNQAFYCSYFFLLFLLFVLILLFPTFSSNPPTIPTFS